MKITVLKKKVNITVIGNKLANFDDDDLYKTLRLKSRLSITNIHLFDTNDKIKKKYSSPEEILTEFCDVRRPYYQKRKEYLLTQLSNRISQLSAKIDFISSLLKENLSFNVLLERLKSSTTSTDTKDLLDMKLSSITQPTLEKLQKEKLELQDQFNTLSDQSADSFWLEDLSLFEKHWMKQS